MRDLPVDEPQQGKEIPAPFTSFEEWEDGYADFLEAEEEGRRQVQCEGRQLYEAGELDE